MKGIVKFLSYSVLALCFLGCTEPVVEKPEQLIPEETMVNIYFDVALFNASRNSGYDQFSAHNIDRWSYIYTKYGIDSTQLANSGLYYTAKPVIHERIYTRVEEKLDSLKKVFDEEIRAMGEEGRNILSDRDSLGNPVDSLKLAVPDSTDRNPAADSLSTPLKPGDSL
ncbi:DUF4296 domain-containing protein [Robertkochia flava]|uniref:DUF4296 domain-containing protein n=1 Tax=Robertkochia flava TaxID=3447986 RepID=UPI001CC99391|nr:DUF4296 domain-containing protein [Robertkochia marina]